VCAAEIDVMAEAAKSLFLVLSALFPIVDPLGGSPIFLSMTQQYSSSTRRALSWRIAVNGFFLLLGSYFIGTHILSFFGISIPVVQVGGGLIVMSSGWTLLKQGSMVSQKGKKQDMEPNDPFHYAFYPLTLPLTVGPGSISVAITLGANAHRLQGLHPFSIVAAILGCLLLAVSIFLCYAFADRLAGILGTTGMTVIIQLTSFLLVCIGVQIAWNGISALLAQVPIHLH
jgi:multiple antibiotic resistance protein